MKFSFSCLLLMLSCAMLSSCKKSSNSTTYTTPGTSKGTVLFWNDNAAIGACGVTIHLSNSDQSGITAAYPATPTSCANIYGGYFYESAGAYTYTVTTTGGCTIAGGSTSVSSGGCNYVKIP